MSLAGGGARFLVVDGELRKALVSLRLLEEDPLPVSGLALRDIQFVERELDCCLPEDVLAAIAANSDELMEQAEMDLALVCPHTQAARSAGCSKDLIAVGRHPDGQAYYCIDRRTNWENQPVIVHDFDLADRSVSRMSFGDWLNELVDARREMLEEGVAEEQARAKLEPTQVQIDAFRPVLVFGADDPIVADEPGPKTVRHKKFGTGTVLSESGEGLDRKLEIDFPEVGKKVILARFLTES